MGHAIVFQKLLPNCMHRIAFACLLLGPHPLSSQTARTSGNVLDLDPGSQDYMDPTPGYFGRFSTFVVLEISLLSINTSLSAPLAGFSSYWFINFPTFVSSQHSWLLGSTNICSCSLFSSALLWAEFFAPSGLTSQGASFPAEGFLLWLGVLSNFTTWNWFTTYFSL